MAAVSFGSFLLTTRLSSSSGTYTDTFGEIENLPRRVHNKCAQEFLDAMQKVDAQKCKRLVEQAQKDSGLSFSTLSCYGQVDRICRFVITEIIGTYPTMLNIEPSFIEHMKEYYKQGLTPNTCLNPPKEFCESILTQVRYLDRKC